MIKLEIELKSISQSTINDHKYEEPKVVNWGCVLSLLQLMVRWWHVQKEGRFCGWCGWIVTLCVITHWPCYREIYGVFGLWFCQLFTVVLLMLSTWALFLGGCSMGY